MSTKHVKLEVDSKTVIRVLSIVVLFVLGLMLIMRMGDALRLVGLAFFLALALNSPVSFMATRLPGNSRALATGVSYLFVVLVLGGLLVSTVPTIVQQTSSFIDSVPSYIQSVQDENSTFSKLVDRYDLQDEVDTNLQNIKDNATDWTTSAVSRVGQFTGSVVTVLTVLVMAFLMLVEAPRWQKLLWNLYTDNKQQKRHQMLAGKMYHVVTGYVNGQVSIATIGASGSLIVLLILSAVFNTPSTIALPLAGIIFVTGLIPMVGATIGAVLVSLFLLLSSLPMALIFLVYFIAYQQFENYVIQPVVQSKALDLSPLIIFVSALVGFYIMGPIGGFVAIPVAGCLRVLLLDYFAHHRKPGSPEQKEASQQLSKIES